MAIPTKDSALADWSTNADTRLNASPATYGTTAAVATQYSAVHDPFITAYNAVKAAREAGTRSSSLVATKDDAKKALLDFARPLYKTIQANTAVTDAAKIELNVVVPDVEPTPVPAPDAAPLVKVAAIYGRDITLSIKDASGLIDGKPQGVIGATVFSFIGEEPPSATESWKTEGQVSRGVLTVQFPETIAPGTKVFFCAYWYSRTGLSGPASTPISCGIGYEGAEPLAA